MCLDRQRNAREIPGNKSTPAVMPEERLTAAIPTNFMKAIFFAAAMLWLLLAGCASLSPEQKLKRDLIGQTTGGGHKAWFFRAGQIELVNISPGGIVDLIVRSEETEERFFLRVKIIYSGDRIESIGLIYIRRVGIE